MWPNKKRERTWWNVCAIKSWKQKHLQRLKKKKNQKIQKKHRRHVVWNECLNTITTKNSVFQFYVGFFITMIMKWRHKHFIYETRTMHCMPTVWCGRSTHILKRSKCQRNQMSCAKKDRERQFIKKKTTTRRTVKPKHCRHWPKCMGKTVLHYRGFWAMNKTAGGFWVIFILFYKL